MTILDAPAVLIRTVSDHLVPSKPAREEARETPVGFSALALFAVLQDPEAAARAAERGAQQRRPPAPRPEALRAVQLRPARPPVPAAAELQAVELRRVASEPEPMPEPMPDVMETMSTHCEVCWTTLRDDNDATANVEWTVPRAPLHCCHGAVCRSCVSQHVQSMVQSAQVVIHCPNWQCGQVLSDETVTSFIPEGIAARLARIKLERDTKRWCPVPTCSAPLPNEVTGRCVTCAACETTSCMRCGGAYHRGLCRRRRDRAVDHWARTKDAKACPKCRKMIHKNGGCMHMTCRTTAGGCGHEFCWMCRGKWIGHNPVLCGPRSVYYLSNAYTGPIMPIRVVTKSIVAGLALGAAGAVAGVAVAGAGLAIGVSPIVGVGLLGREARRRRRRRQQMVFRPPSADALAWAASLEVGGPPGGLQEAL